MRMGYNQMQSFGGICHLVKFTKGEMMFYINFHAILSQNIEWRGCLSS